MDWENRYLLIDNLEVKLGPEFARLIEGVENGSLPAEYENVFLREDHIRRTAASTGGEVSEEEYRGWQQEYAELMAQHEHGYVNDFGTDTEVIYNTIAERFNLKPETVRIRLQFERPGRMFIVHIDRHRYRVWDMEEEVRYEKVREQHSHNIYITFLQDQQLGQMFGMGYETLRWRAGDTYTWEHQSIPHYTANAGYWTNYILVTTGEPVDVDETPEVEQKTETGRTKGKKPRGRTKGKKQQEV
jgi:hypothetical protein